MDYNTNRSHLHIREYGRNIQALVDYALTIENDEKRNQFALYIIDLMGQMNPHLRNVEEFKRKLWDHLFVISDFRLKVDSPFPVPTRADIEKVQQPAALEYPQKNPKYRQYGNNVELMVKKVLEMEDPEKKEAYAEIIGNYMKLVYQNWNNDNSTNETIKADFAGLTKGIMELNDEADLDNLTRSNRRKRKPSGKSNGSYSQARKKGKRRNYKN
jgi:Domain of unknown function (DUF4290)